MFIQVTPYLCTELDFIKTLEFTGQKNIITLSDNSKHEVNDKIAKEIYDLKKGESKMNKFIFLDIDGVLNDNETYTKAPYGGTGINDSHLFQLKQLVDNTGAKIILSSDWRFNSPDWPWSWPDWDSESKKLTWIYLNKQLENFDLEIHDIIKHHVYRRGTEITMYLSDKLPCQYVILDDLPPIEFMTHLPHLVNTDYRTGLTWEDIWEAQEKMKIIEKEVKA